MVYCGSGGRKRAKKNEALAVAKESQGTEGIPSEHAKLTWLLQMARLGFSSPRKSNGFFFVNLSYIARVSMGCARRPIVLYV